MSGHSKWHSIKHKKAAADAKRGKVFTKYIREITILAKLGGGDVASNSRLRLAVQKAKAANMPASNIDRAIKKGTGELPGVSYEEVVYEGYLPYGIACIIDVLTDNKNRSVAEIRKLFSKNGGNLGASGAVSWMFETQGLILVNLSEGQDEELMELSIEAGALNMDIDDDIASVYTLSTGLEEVRSVLSNNAFSIESASLTRIAKDLVKLSEDEASRIMSIVELLEEHDDIQSVATNFDF